MLKILLGLNIITFLGSLFVAARKPPHSESPLVKKLVVVISAINVGYLKAIL